jgi:toluene monooxygenase system protein E
MAQHSYWHLRDRLQHGGTGQPRELSDYEIVTSRLLYYPERGVEVPSPVARWCAEQQANAALRSSDWDAFSDPRQTTYSSYMAAAQAREAVLDELLERCEQSDERLSPRWLHALDAVLPVLRFPVHGLQMVSAYIGSQAPSGRLTVTAAFQAADEMRLLQRLAYRMRQLQRRMPEFGEHSKQTWQVAPAWQPLRRAIEQLLVTYDWTKALLVSSLRIKPLLVELFLVQFGRVAAAAGDELLQEILLHLADDQSWHDAWAAAVLAPSLETAENRQRALDILASQESSVVNIVEDVVRLFEESKPAGVSFDGAAVKLAVQAALLKRERSVGLAR